MKKIFSILAIVIVCSSCEKTKKTTPEEQPSLQDTTSKIIGTVTQFNQYSSQYTVNLNTTLVSVNGLTNVAITDTKGNYTLTGIPAGIYDVSFNKFGCGLWQQQKVNVVKTVTSFVSGYAVEIPTYSFTSANIVDSNLVPNHKVYATVNLTPVPEKSGALVISGTNPNLDITVPSSYTKLVLATVPANYSTYTFLYGVGMSGFNYYKIYPYSSVSNAASYYDYASTKNIYSAYGPSVTTTFTTLIP